MRKSRLQFLEQILATKRYGTFFWGVKIHLGGNVKYFRLNGKFLGESNIFWGKNSHFWRAIITLGWPLFTISNKTTHGHNFRNLGSTLTLLYVLAAFKVITWPAKAWITLISAFMSLLQRGKGSDKKIQAAPSFPFQRHLPGGLERMKSLTVPIRKPIASPKTM